MSRRAANDSPDEDEEDEFSEPEDYGRSAPGRGGGDDDDFEFEDSVGHSGPGGGGAVPVQNQPFDEAVDLSESEDNASTNASPAPRGPRTSSSLARCTSSHRLRSVSSRRAR